MSIITPEIPTVFGALDSSVFEDGGPVDALVTRDLGRSANRLACMGEPLARFVYDASIDGMENSGQLLAYGHPFWFQITPGPITRPKHPGLTRGKLFLYYTARAGEVLDLQVHTVAHPFSPTALNDGENTVQLVGAGADAWEELDDIPLTERNAEQIALFLRGVPTSTLGNTGTYGGPNTGTVSNIITPTLIEDVAATWNYSGNTWASGGHAIIFENAAGVALTSPRSIVGVVDQSALNGQPHSTWLQIYPALDSGWGTTSLVGATYRIVELPRIRIYSAMIYAKNREA